jgi:hypothetical protein
VSGGPRLRAEAASALCAHGQVPGRAGHAWQVVREPGSRALADGRGGGQERRNRKRPARRGRGASAPATQGPRTRHGRCGAPAVARGLGALRSQRGPLLAKENRSPPRPHSAPAARTVALLRTFASATPSRLSASAQPGGRSMRASLRWAMADDCAGARAGPRAGRSRVAGAPGSRAVEDGRGGGKERRKCKRLGAGRHNVVRPSSEVPLGLGGLFGSGYKRGHFQDILNCSPASADASLARVAGPPPTAPSPPPLVAETRRAAHRRRHVRPEAQWQVGARAI